MINNGLLEFTNTAAGILQAMLVYELMEGGSLADHLYPDDEDENMADGQPQQDQHKENLCSPDSCTSKKTNSQGHGSKSKPPLSWVDRVRITQEVAAGLLHLHTSKPAVVHL